MTEAMKKKILIFAVIAAASLVVINRAREIIIENARVVFNIARHEAKYGTPAEVTRVETRTGHLYEPVAVQNGNIFVSGSRINRFRGGQRLSHGGTITSVSRSIDLDTGLFIIRTTAPTGNGFVEIEHNGIFVPLSAISKSAVMIVQDGIAVARPVSVIAADAERAVVTGLADGDIVILTRIVEGTKANIVITTE